MKAEGPLYKMKTKLNNPVDYQLAVGEQLIGLNDLIGKDISLIYQGRIYCVKCGKKTYKSFGQGFCYNCFITAPEADPAIIHPELDLAHEGISRDMEWAKEFSLTDHYVYLAFTGAVKVGVTRSVQVITRWIDQGATAAIKLAKVPYRQLAGKIEVELKNYFSDKTNWRLMLTDNFINPTELLIQKEKATGLLSEEMQAFILPDDEITFIQFPVIQYPQKLSSVSFDKVNAFQGRLTGMKGQYLILDDNRVINIRSHSGYYINLDF